MRIIVQEKTGGPETLAIAERPTPVPGRGEVLIKVAAAGINPIDVFVSRGQAQLLGDPPFTVGWDIAGTVTALGGEVTQFAVGDRVFGMPRFPGGAAAYAEYAVAPADELARVPQGLDDIHAGALPLAGLTAWQALVEHTAVEPGERILIYAAAGGVGHLAVQIAKARGAEVTASASAGKHDFLASIGADHIAGHVVDGPGSYDVVFEIVGGDHMLTALAMLKPGGRLISIKGLEEKIAEAARAQGKSATGMLVHPDGDGMKALAGLIVDGALEVHVARTFPLAEAGAAQTFLDTRPIGKIVLTM
jgi:NADPH:quinone reductase-like Zn-dependent oxidoreductase